MPNLSEEEDEPRPPQGSPPQPEAAALPLIQDEKEEEEEEEGRGMIESRSPVYSVKLPLRDVPGSAEAIREDGGVRRAGSYGEEEGEAHSLASSSLCVVLMHVIILFSMLACPLDFFEGRE